MSVTSSISDTVKAAFRSKPTPPEAGMLKVGDSFPKFKVNAVKADLSSYLKNDHLKPAERIKEALVEMSSEDFPGKWLVIFAWPKDYTHVCPTEIVEFSRLNSEFEDRDAQILGFSIDSAEVHVNWRTDTRMPYHKDLESLQFPMLSDLKKHLTIACGIEDSDKGVAQRAVFIVDPDHIVRFSMVTDLQVGRNPKEVLRVLDALQTGGLCPCDWQKGEATL